MTAKNMRLSPFNTHQSKSRYLLSDLIIVVAVTTVSHHLVFLLRPRQRIFFIFEFLIAEKNSSSFSHEKEK